MTQTKLEIIGPYTPEHEGPFCTRDGRPAEVVTANGRGLKRIFGYIGDDETFTGWFEEGTYLLAGKTSFDLMNAREVPVAREFWVNEYFDGSRSVYSTQEEAQKFIVCLKNTIHVREVLPGEGA